MSDLRIEATRGDLVESVHVVSAAVVHADGRPAAFAGDPALVSYWRSAAKPFQALPLVADGAADAIALTTEELALACASHSSESVHRAVAQGLLDRLGLSAADLACGPHAPYSPSEAERVVREGVTMTPLWSNCSGKHAGMLALARHHGWPTASYERPDHPVQRRILAEVARWTGVPAESIATATDGCAAVTFALPLAAMARAWARLGTSSEPAAARVRHAMAAHPELVAGRGRLCTDLMAGAPGRVLAKVGAAGIYCAALPELGLGVALKVTDGDSDVSGTALLAVLAQVVACAGASGRYGLDALAAYGDRPVLNTRGTRVGVVRAAGRLRLQA